MDDYRKKFNNENQTVLFFMASDDIEWVTTLFSNISDVILTLSAPAEFQKRQPTFDLATMSLCNHSIFRYLFNKMNKL